MRKSVLSLVSSASTVLAVSLLGAPVQARAANHVPAASASATSTRAGGAFTVSAQDCGPWGCEYAPPYVVVSEPTGCHSVPPVPSTAGSRWTQWWNGTDRIVHLFVDGTCTGVADAVLGGKSVIELNQAPYRSVRFG